MLCHTTRAYTIDVFWKIVQSAWHMYDDDSVDVARDREGDLEDIARHGRRRERS